MRSMLLRTFGLLWSGVPLILLAAAPEPPSSSSRPAFDFFERRVRPVLIERCYSCHSAAQQKAEGGVTLDSPDALRQPGDKGIPVVPGDPAQSRLIQVLRRPHPESAQGRQLILPPVFIADLQAWIRMGAPDPRIAQPGGVQKPTGRAHWAYQPIGHPDAPPVRLARWVQDPVDQFILSRMDKDGVSPAPPAPPAAWLRRVSFDLTGLPPAPEDLEALNRDASSAARAKIVDRLLSSAQFGEHWGGLWLEALPYSDLGGSDPRDNAWRYRDYVVAALNADKPYDAFVREQIAGDLLTSETDDPAVTRECRVATGFLMVGARFPSGITGPRLPLEVADEQVEVVTRTFLGLTVACARCHDHKTDPISMREYHAMAGIFASTASLAEGAEAGARGTLHWLQTTLATPQEEEAVQKFRARYEELKEQWREAREMKVAFPGEIDSTALVGVVVDNLAAEIRGAWKESNYSTNFVDRNYLHDGDADKGKKSARFVPDLPKDGAYEVFISYTPRANRATNVPVTVTCRTGVKTVRVNQTLAPTTDKVFTSIGKFTFKAGTNGSVQISNEGTKGFVVVDAVRFVPAEEAAALHAPPAADEETALLNFKQLEKEMLEFASKRPVLPQAMAVREGRIADLRLPRGPGVEKPGEEVPRGFLSALGVPDSTLYVVTDESSGRLELANWLVNPDNPLTARVAVNRTWSQLFGKGLVDDPNDFGSRTAPPSHPELLDYLARRFMDQGWSLKKLIRSLVLSSSYQMTSRPPADTLAKDPQNRLFSRANLRTLDPACLRDALLVLSGELDRTIGGTWLPANLARTPQPARRVQATSLRRSLYLPVVRDREADALRVLSLGAEKEPVPEGAALAEAPPAEYFKDRFLSERIWHWSDQLLHSTANSSEERIAQAFRQALGRMPSPGEQSQALQIVASGTAARGEAGVRQPVATGPSGWEQLCARLLASIEFRTLQ